MELLIHDLQAIQNELDSRIFTLHDTTREKTRNDRILALLVETGELANETRCFKYWSLRAPSDNETVFEEFSDVLHFTLSLGIDIDFSDACIVYEKSSLILNDQFHQVYRLIQLFSTSNRKEDYRALFASILSLAYSLGMNNEVIRNMYLMKNQKNHQRQDDKY
ncbi:hypothetical protein AOC36_09810 [Erysipelothrix larvae]|uniref:dUTPase n=1 Tax=Erysipelothrix larvae TaxID=1514105 RepID=A0A109UHH2_9FIRM|nr:dUTP diphosphatase [Erysipelothrix larvae]AMC94262.1 hypothetical protein AOC36_09810 [Erysipelothrix larvae]